MSKQANPKVVGGFVLGAIALVVIVFVIFGSAEFFKETYDFVIYFEGDVTGLRVGSPVKVRGVDIGSVSKINPLYDEKGDFLIEVVGKVYKGMIHDSMGFYEEMESEEYLDHLIGKGLRARLESQSILTGVKYIKFDSFPEAPLKLMGFNKRSLEVPSIRTTQEELQLVLRRALGKLRELDFDKLFTRMQDVLDTMSSTLAGVDSLMNSPELKEMFSSVSNNMTAMDNLISDLNEKLDPLLENKVDVLLSDLSVSSKALTRTLERGEKLLASMEATAVDERYALNTALSEIAKSSRAIRLLVDHLQRRPRSVIFGKN